MMTAGQLRGISASLSLLLALAAAAPALPAQRPEIPPLPEPSFDGFFPVVRQQMRQAYESVTAQPLEVERNGRLGMVFHSYEKFQWAAVCYERAHRLAPMDFRWPYLLGVVQQALGNDSDAVVSFRAALQINSEHPYAQLFLADSLTATGDREEAIAVYRKVVERNPEIPQAHYRLGRALSAKGETPEVIQHYRKACELFPSYAAAHYSLALAYRRLGKTEEAGLHLARHETVKDSAPPTSEPLLKQVSALNYGLLDLVLEAQRLEGQGKLPQEAEVLEKALQIDAELAQAHVDLISVYGRLGRAKAAEKHHRDAVRLDPKNAKSYYSYGVLCFSQGSTSEAKRAYVKALEIDPGHAHAHNNLGFILLQDGQIDEAMSHFRRAVEIDPGHAIAQYHLGSILAQRGDYRAALECFSKTLAAEDENTPAYHYALATVHRLLGNRPQAGEHFRKAQAAAIQFGQKDLLNKIEQDLRLFERGPPQ